MKAMKIFAAIVAALTVSVTASAKTVVKYHTGNDNQQYRIAYTLDDQDRVVTKIVMVKNGYQEWTPKYAYSMFYSETDNVVTYAAWDKKTRTFTRNPQQQHFDPEQQDVLMAIAE